MTKDVFIALLTEEGHTKWEAMALWNARPKGIVFRADWVRATARQMLPVLKRLRDLERARGATNRPDL
jgi:hypothetical protein